jgi:hypothetical protein
MCDDDGPCERGEKMLATGRLVDRSLELAIQDDEPGAMEALNEALGETAADGFFVFMALSSVARTYFEMNVPHGSPHGWGLKAVSGPDMTQRDIEELPPGPVFAGRFVTAYANGDLDMCVALYTATLDNPDLTIFADGLKNLFNNCVVYAKEIAAMRGDMTR